MTTIDNIQNTILPRPFWGVDKGGYFIGFLSFIAINCLIFIVIGDKLKYDKNETYTPKIFPFTLFFPYFIKGKIALSEFFFSYFPFFRSALTKFLLVNANFL